MVFNRGYKANHAVKPPRKYRTILIPLKKDMYWPDSDDFDYFIDHMVILNHFPGSTDHIKPVGVNDNGSLCYI